MGAALAALVAGGVTCFLRKDVLQLIANAHKTIFVCITALVHETVGRGFVRQVDYTNNNDDLLIVVVPFMILSILPANVALYILAEPLTEILPSFKGREAAPHHQDVMYLLEKWPLLAGYALFMLLAGAAGVWMLLLAFGLGYGLLRIYSKFTKMDGTYSERELREYGVATHRDSWITVVVTEAFSLKLLAVLYLVFVVIYGSAASEFKADVSKTEDIVTVAALGALALNALLRTLLMRYIGFAELGKREFLYMIRFQQAILSLKYKFSLLCKADERDSMEETVTRLEKMYRDFPANYNEVAEYFFGEDLYETLDAGRAAALERASREGADLDSLTRPAPPPHHGISAIPDPKSLVKPPAPPVRRDTKPPTTLMPPPGLFDEDDPHV